jgi:hypothetical protein
MHCLKIIYTRIAGYSNGVKDFNIHDGADFCYRSMTQVIAIARKVPIFNKSLS